MKYFIFCALFLLHGYAFSQTAILEAYGDSVTAGLLNYTNVTHETKLTTVSTILSDLTMFKLTKDRAYLNKHEKGELAWPQLLAQHLTTTEMQFEVRNYGLSGAQSENLITEVSNAKDVAPEEPVIAFFLIGYNDLCHNINSEQTLASNYNNNLDKALEIWDKNHKGGKAYLISLADVQKIYPLLDGQVWFESSKGRYRCNESWEKLFPYCPTFSKKFKEGTLNDYLAPRVDALNNTLKELTEKWKNKSIRNQYFRIEPPLGMDFQKDHFAIDCYHLSNKGQSFVSKQIFDSVGWQ